jgi:TatD DNase family protein
VIDTHAHLYDPRFDEDRDAVIARARDAGISRIVIVGTQLSTSESAIRLAREHSGLSATVGLHPATRVDDWRAEIAAIEELARRERDVIVGWGEFGLDFHWKDVPREEQFERLDAQLEIALSWGLPAIFHVRDAMDELLGVLERRHENPSGVFHCFSGGPESLRRVLALGYSVSFGGNVTYPKATSIAEAARATPLHRLLLETDAPYLPPQPKRGKRNEPLFVRFTAEFLAERLGLPLATLVEETDATAHRIFRFHEFATRGAIVD